MQWLEWLTAKQVFHFKVFHSVKMNGGKKLVAILWNIISDKLPPCSRMQTVSQNWSLHFACYKFYQWRLQSQEWNHSLQRHCWWTLSGQVGWGSLHAVLPTLPNTRQSDRCLWKHYLPTTTGELVRAVKKYMDFPQKEVPVLWETYFLPIFLKIARKKMGSMYGKHGDLLLDAPLSS